MGEGIGRRILSKVRSLALSMVFGIVLAGGFIYLSYPADAERVPILRMLSPENYGMTCQGNVCAEEPEALADAVDLYVRAKQELLADGVALKYFEPNFLFCVTEDCFYQFVEKTETEDYFDVNAVAIPLFGTVVKPLAWTHGTVSHEFIHHVQYETWMLNAPYMPKWMTEGMAYHHTRHNMAFMSPEIVAMVERYSEWAGELSLHEALAKSETWMKENPVAPWQKRD